MFLPNICVKLCIYKEGMCMNIQKVQANQINFGTRVYFEPGTKDILLNSNAKRKIKSHINKLESNGINDELVLRHEVDKTFGIMTHIYGTVFEKRGKSIFKTPYGSVDALETPVYNRKLDITTHEYANILRLYNEAKYNWEMRKINNEAYKNYISGLERIDLTD